jgi:sterol desaturase/sphingolipid hydroxylase (fatty acid hydroxylase superfamily)
MSNIGVSTPASLRRAREASKARHRLYPVTVLYTATASTLLGFALASDRRWVGLGVFAAGVASWTLIEYLVHRFVLHGRFPDGPGAWRHFLHTHFDHLHWEHHERPWDGDHISGTIRDTFRFVLPMLALSFLAPPFTATLFVAGIIQSYVVEEWVHHSVHFYDLEGRYFLYIRRHHLFHHSPKGEDVGFGLTSGIWDVVFGTRIPALVRQALYGHRRSTSVQPSSAATPRAA